MKLLRALRAMGVALGLTIVGAGLAFAVLPTPDQGLRLTDWFSLQQAITNRNQTGFASLTPGAANTQSTCASVVTPMVSITTSVANGSICLPTATGGREVFIANGSGQTVNTFTSNSPFTVGTADTINGSPGSTAYTSLTTGKNLHCFTPANGSWFCTAGN